MQRVPDPYRILGIGREATTAEVRAAHRRLAKRYHPDAPHADAARFLAVQDAYELLRDALRRREWDLRHAPGPVRAEPTSTEPRRRRTATTAGPAEATPPASPRSRRRRPAGTEATFGPNDRPPHADSWTWTAEGVPWWEDSGSPRTRRTARRRSTAGPTDEPAATAADAAGPPGADAATGEHGAPGPGSRPRRATAAAEAPGVETRNDFDVYARSSGAAWSSASRAYFRRRAADMPSGAANPNTPRWTTPVGAPPSRRYEAASTAAGDRSRPATPPGSTESARSTASAGSSAPPGPDAPRTPGPAHATEPPTTSDPRSASSGPTTPPGPTAHAQPAATAPAQPGVASRRLGAALAALLRRGDR